MSSQRGAPAEPGLRGHHTGPQGRAGRLFDGAARHRAWRPGELAQTRRSPRCPGFHLPLLGVGILVLVLFAEGSGLIPLSAMSSEMQAPSQTVRLAPCLFRRLGKCHPARSLERVRSSRGSEGAGSTARTHRGCAQRSAAGRPVPHP